MIRAAGSSTEDMRILAYTPEGYISAKNFVPDFYMSSGDVMMPEGQPIKGRGMQKAITPIVTERNWGIIVDEIKKCDLEKAFLSGDLFISKTPVRAQNIYRA